MKKTTGPIFELHFMRNNKLVIDKTQGLIHYPHLRMQVKTASSETTTKPEPVITDDALTIPPTTTKTIKALVDPIGEVYGNSRFADSPHNVDNK